MTEAAPDKAVEAGRGALWIGLAKAFFMLSGFVQNVVLTRLLSAADFGAYGVVTKIVSIVNNATVQASIQSVAKFTAEDDARAPAIRRAGLRVQGVLGAALGAGFFFGAPLIADAVKAPAYAGWFRLVALIPFLYSLYAVFVGSANGLRRFNVQAGFDIGFSTAKTVLVLGGAAAIGLGGALGGFVGAAAFILVVATRVMGTRAEGERFPVKRIAAFMAEVVTYGLVLNLALNYDLPLLRRLAGGVAETGVADALAGNYEAMRTLALLPYMALIVVTFVIFPLVSRSTFTEDREATRAYVTQSLRFALIGAAAMGVALAARPGTLLAILYRPEYGQGATALPILVAGQCCLAMLAVACTILNAAGRVRAAVVLVSGTVALGATVAALLVPTAAPGPQVLRAAATGSAVGMIAGFLAAVFYLRARLGGGPPPATALRVAIAVMLAAGGARLVPGGGKVAGLAAIALTGFVYLGALVALREFSAADREKLAKILRRR